MDEDLSALWDPDFELRHRSAVHEAGHAAYAWFYSTRDPSAAPFKAIHLDDEVNDSGCVYGHVEPVWECIPSEATVKGAIILAGIYAQENCGRCSARRWAEIVNGRDSASGGVDDYCAGKELADQTGADWDAFVVDVLNCLRRAKGMRRPILSLARFLERSGDLDITNRQVLRVLDRIPVRQT